MNFPHNEYNLFSESIDLIVSNSSSEYLSSYPSPKCDYGYQAYDHTDTGYDYVPVYDWIELNSLSEAINLELLDDTITTVDLPFGGSINVLNSATISRLLSSNNLTESSFHFLALIYS